MNNRFTIQELAGLLATQTGKKKKETEQFLKEFVAVVTEGVYTDKIVKVKGLGTFKIILVDKRESINVNTGERILIPEHYKFSYLPDKELKELVNKPFAAFETTKVNDHADFSDLEHFEENDDDEKEEVIEDEIVEDTKVSENINPEIEKTQEESVKETDTIILSKDKIEEEVLEETTLLQQPTQENIDLSEESTTIIPPPPVQEEKDTSYTKQEKKEEKVSPILIVGLILAAIFACFSLYLCFFGNPFQGDRSTKSNAVEETIVQPEVIEPIAKEEPITAPVIESTPERKTTPIEKKSKVIPQKSKVETSSLIRKSTDKNTLAVVRVNEGSRLTLIALKYFKNKAFWVYIYEHNKAIIKDPDIIPAGLEVKVPIPSLYGIDASNPTSVSKAKALELEIKNRKK